MIRGELGGELNRTVKYAKYAERGFRLGKV
jgi:hypothetical protein